MIGDEEDDHETLATIFQALKERAASKMASRAATQNGPSVTIPDTALFQEPPPLYTSGVNSPVLHPLSPYATPMECFDPAI
jgi:hypothetical protein